MPLYSITNNRKGGWSLLRANQSPVYFQPGESRDVDMSDEDARSADYPGVEIRKVDTRAAAKAKAEAEAQRLEAERKAAEEAAAKAKEGRDALVARAAELKVEHAADIDDEALKALIAAAEANAAQSDPAAGK